MKRITISQMLVFLTLPASPALAMRENYGAALAMGDLNGDGYADLAIGIKGSNYNNLPEGGAANVLYGTANGLSLTGQQVVTIPPERVCYFAGRAVAIGDFNGDGYGDLALAASCVSIGPAFRNGIQVCMGNAGGIDIRTCQMFTLDHDNSDIALVAADFNRDGHDDLVAGNSYDSVNGITFAGSVTVYYGTWVGLDRMRTQVLTQDTPGVPSAAEPTDFFGSALATGDFDADGYPDLAIGSKHEAVYSVSNAGAVFVVYGAAAGLDTNRAQVFHAGGKGIPGGAVEGAQIGASLAAGNFGYDRPTDLAIAAPGEAAGGVRGAGKAYVLWGIAGVGLVSSSVKTIYRGSGAIGSPRVDERFGEHLAGGDTNGDGWADLLVAAAGSVTIIKGGGGPMSPAGGQYFTQDTYGVAGVGGLGPVIALGDIDHDGFHDLAIGTPDKDIKDAAGVTHSDMGMVNVLFGTPTGVWTPRSQVFSLIESPDFYR